MVPGEIDRDSQFWAWLIEIWS